MYYSQPKTLLNVSYMTHVVMFTRSGSLGNSTWQTATKKQTGEASPAHYSGRAVLPGQYFNTSKRTRIAMLACRSQLVSHASVSRAKQACMNPIFPETPFTYQ